jgi:CDP-glucose 4,6-dehydratase
MKEFNNMGRKKRDDNFEAQSPASSNPSILNIYREKVVLVTGHTGFKGTWLTIWLKALGAHVVGYSLEPNTKPSIFEETGLESKITHIIGDLRDENHLTEVLQNYNPEFVFHLAAQSLVRLSYKKPKLTYETNVIGLVYLLEAVRKTNSVRVVINVSSDKCYENKEWVWGYRENDPMGGYDPYSSSKGCSELITRAYRRSFFKNGENNHVNLASARAGNVIGGGDWAKDRIVPDCVRFLTSKKPIEIRNPHAIRPWQYVLEPLSGYLWLGAQLSEVGRNFASSWNFGPIENQTMTVKELVQQMINIWGEGSWVLQQDAHMQPHEANYLKLDCSKAYRILKWHAIYDIHETIINTVNWYKSYYKENVDAYELCLKQIEKYVTKARYKNIPWSSIMSIDF